MNELSIELTMLLWSTVLFVLHVGVAAVGADASNGIGWAFGNRDTQPELPTWVDRSRRAQANMAENLLPFACFVIIVHLSGDANQWSALGAQLFLVARLAYLPLYLFGVKVVRSLAYMVGLVGMLMVAVQLF
jgi:uncharacterized MAPEG superfamily protein